MFKTTFKRFIRLFVSHANHAVVSQISAEKHFELAATQLIDNIHRLDNARLDNIQAIRKTEQSAVNYSLEAEKIEAQIESEYKESGKEPSEVRVKLMLRERGLSNVLTANVGRLKASNIEISAAITQLGDNLDTIKDSIELARLEKDIVAEGLASPEDVQDLVARTQIDVSRLLSEVEVFARPISVAPGVSDIDVDGYIQLLKSRA